MDTSDIDTLVKRYNSNPNSDDYFIISNWYDNNTNHQDQEYLICIFLFLIGSNIKKRWVPIPYEQHMQYIKRIRELIEDAEPLYKQRRKIYLDYGTKAV